MFNLPKRQAVATTLSALAVLTAIGGFFSFQALYDSESMSWPLFWGWPFNATINGVLVVFVIYNLGLLFCGSKSNTSTAITYIAAVACLSFSGLSFLESLFGENLGVDAFFSIFSSEAAARPVSVVLNPGPALYFLLAGAFLVTTRYKSGSSENVRFLNAAVAALLITYLIFYLGNSVPGFVAARGRDRFAPPLLAVVIPATLSALAMILRAPGLTLKGGSTKGYPLALGATIFSASISTAIFLLAERHKDATMTASAEQRARYAALDMETKLTEIVKDFYLLTTPTSGAEPYPRDLMGLPHWTSMLGEIGIVAAAYAHSSGRVTAAWPPNLDKETISVLQSVLARPADTLSPGPSPLATRGIVFGPLSVPSLGEVICFGAADHIKSDHIEFAGVIPVGSVARTINGSARFSQTVQTKDGAILYQSRPIERIVPDSDRMRTTLSLPGVSLVLAAYPTTELLKANHSPFQASILFSGYLLAGLLGFSVFSNSLASMSKKDLSRSLGWQNAVSDASHLMIYSTDRQGRIVTMNKVAEERLGYSLEEVKGKLTPRLWISDDTIAWMVKTFGGRKEGIDEVFQLFCDHLAREGSLSKETTYKTKSGDLIPVRKRLQPVTSTTGEVLGFAALAEDITEEKEREKELENYRERMIASSKMAALGEVASSIAHEINSPLFALRAQIAALSYMDIPPGLDKSSLTEVATTMDRLVDRISKIVRGLKNFARGSTSDPYVESSAKGIVSDCLSLCTNRLSRQSVDLKLELPENDCFLECREIQISQILLNLINNALDAAAATTSDSSQEGLRRIDPQHRVAEPKPWVLIRLEDQGDEVSFTVKDSGPGIPKEIRQKIMEPFFTTKPAGQGTGLGLSISQRIAAEHNGRLELDESAQNTTLTLTIPKKHAPTGAPTSGVA